MHFSHKKAMPARSIETYSHIPQALPPLLETLGDLERECRGYTVTHSSAISSYPDQLSSLKRQETGNKSGDKSSCESFRPEFVALQHNNFRFKTAADSHCDILKAKVNRVPPRDQSSSHSMLNETIYIRSRRPHPVSLLAELPIRSRELTPLECRAFSFSNYDHYNEYPWYSSIHGTYRYHATEEMGTEGTSSRKRLPIADLYSAQRYKRRSPGPSGHYSIHGPASFTDAMRRGEGAVHSSSTPSHTGVSQGSSISSTAAAPSTRTNSHLPVSFYHRTGSLNPSSYGFNPQIAMPSRGSSISRPHSTESAMSAFTKRQGFWMCECCPTSLKKFSSPKALAAHKAEKQYECNYCGNHFKNKNEAERHKSSVHIQRRSMSCSALPCYDRAFFMSAKRPGEADVCGYCGDEFARTGDGPGPDVFPKRTTDQDWDERIRHLKKVHRFKACNSSKKFYRADHFRQHLKLCHATTSGRWITMLEDACLIDKVPILLEDRKIR